MRALILSNPAGKSPKQSNLNLENLNLIRRTLNPKPYRFWGVDKNSTRWAVEFDQDDDRIASFRVYRV